MYVSSLKYYRNDLKDRLRYTKAGKKIELEGMNRTEQMRHSKIMYLSIMNWEAKDFGSIIRNQGYFQRGIIHTIVDEKNFSWDLGDNNEH